MGDAKTVEEWREIIDNDSDLNSKRGRFRLLPRDLFNSRAFAKLTRGGMIAVLSALNKLEYETTNKDRKGVKSNVTRLKHGGRFSLTINELRARGISKASATRGRMQAWELGFFDVVSPGTIHHAGIYKVSDRWRQYPNGDWRPTDQQRPGLNVYPENSFKKRDHGKSENDSDVDFGDASSMMMQ